MDKLNQMNHENIISKLPNAKFSNFFTFIKLKLAIYARIMSKNSQMKHEDRISRLPDAILCKILSFLSLKSAVRTSILSSRWKRVWIFLEDFDFDFDFNFDKYPGKTKFLHFRHSRQESLLPYVRFVNEVLSNRDPSSKIGRLRLSFRINVDPIFIQNCIHYAAIHHVEDLDLDAFHHPIPFRFPIKFLGSQSLQKLRLKYYYGENTVIPKPFCFPNLKILYLENFPFKDDDDFCFPKEPFSCFTKLEELTLDSCEIDGLIILAPELKVLELQFGRHHVKVSFEAKILTAVTPKLKSFKFEGHVSLIFPTEELPCLDNVYVDLCFLKLRYNDTVKKKMPINLFKLLEQFENVNTLTLSFRTIEVLSMDLRVLEQYPSPFINLKKLKFVGAPPERRSNGLPSQNIMAYLTDASSFGDSMIVETPRTCNSLVNMCVSN